MCFFFFKGSETIFCLVHSSLFSAASYNLGLYNFPCWHLENRPWFSNVTLSYPVAFCSLNFRSALCITEFCFLYKWPYHSNLHHLISFTIFGQLKIFVSSWLCLFLQFRISWSFTGLYILRGIFFSKTCSLSSYVVCNIQHCLLCMLLY